METEEILTKARTGQDIPHDWVVFPLLRDKLIWSIVNWVAGLIMSVALLALVAPIVIPHNFLYGVGPAIFTLLLLGLLCFVVVGCAWLLVVDVNRLRYADKHLIVITDEDFVKQEGRNIIRVPLSSVRHVTPRGQPPTEADEEANVTAFRRGKRPRRQRMRAPTSLAFIDTRTDAEVTVVKDLTYGDPFTIAGVLKEYITVIQ